MTRSGNPGGKPPLMGGLPPAKRYLAISLGYLFLITIAEAVTTLWNPQIGVLLHGGVLLMLLLHGSLIHRGMVMRFVILLSIAPLIRILSLSIPLQRIGLPLVYWYMVIGMLLFLAAILASRVTGLHGNRIGWSVGVWPLQIGIGLIGFGLGYIEFRILQPGPLAAYVTWADILMASLILLIFTGLLEEFIFRGLMQSASMQLMGRFGLIYVALIFAVLHLGYHSIADLLFVLLVGLLFGWLVWKTQSILGVSLAHGIANISLYVLYPLVISAGSLPVASAEPATSTPSGTVQAATPVRITDIANGDMIVDDTDPGFVFMGKNIWLDSTGGFAGSFRWSYIARSVPDVVVTWVPPLAGCGNYRVEAHIPAGSGLTLFAEYVIHHHGGTDVHVVNQALAAGSWTTLGFFEFAGQSPADVQLSNRTGENPKLLRWIGFDAVRWIYISACSATTPAPEP